MARCQVLTPPPLMGEGWVGRHADLRKQALAELEGEFANYGERYKTQTTSVVHCEKIIRLALDNAGIAVIESLLKGRSGP